MTDHRTTELLRKLLEERGVEWWESRGYGTGVVYTFWNSPIFGRVHAIENDDGTLFMTCLNNLAFTPEQAVAVTLGSEHTAHGTLTAEQVRKAIRKYAHDDSCYIFEVYGEMCGPIADELNAERHVETCEPPYDELLRCLENDWHISASWDGLRKFWCIELTEDGVKLRDAYDEALRRIAALEELVWFMVPFFDSAVSHECGCPDGYFEPHGCDDGCKALKELDERMKELGIEVDR